MTKISKILNIAGVASVAALSVPALLTGTPLGSSYAYLTDIGETQVNKCTIALDPSAKVVEYFPTFTKKEIKGTVYHFRKGVQIFNDGYVDAYVRARIDFTDSDIKDSTTFSWDGKNFYSFDEFCNHVEENGWHYCAADGYFYYKTSINAGDYEKFQQDMTKDEETKVFNWNKESSLGTTEIGGVTIATKPLIQYVETSFPEPGKMRNYTIEVSQDAVASYLGDDYAAAWKSVLGYDI